MSERKNSEAAYASFLLRKAGWETIVTPPGREAPVLGLGGALDDPHATGIPDGSNLAVRMPVADNNEWRVIGLSVRSDGKREGYEAMMALVDKLGRPPLTHISTCFASDPDSRLRTNGIRFYRVPGDVELARMAGRNVFICGGGREPSEAYAMVAPSVVDGRRYVLRSPGGGHDVACLPQPERLPFLPPAWVDHITAKADPAVILELSTAR